MRVIVPLKGLLGGRYGLALGCIIPLLSFYFIQLRPKKLLSPSPPKPPQPDSPKPDEAIQVQAPIAARALSVISIQHTPFYLGDKEVTANAFDAAHNPSGCIELGMSENKVGGRSSCLPPCGRPSPLSHEICGCGVKCNDENSYILLTKEVTEKYLLWERDSTSSSCKLTSILCFQRTAQAPPFQSSRLPTFIGTGIIQYNDPDWLQSDVIKQLSLDLLHGWLSKWRYTSADLSEGAGYVNFSGMQSLRTVLARFMGNVMGGRVKFEPSQMVLTAGATATTEMLAFCLAQPGDAFLIPSPYYAGFDRDIKWRSQVELIPVPCYSDTNFTITHAALESTYRKLRKRGIKVRGVLITNPSNPVGNVLDAATLTSILTFAKEKKIHLIVDEIYAACTFDGTAFTSVAEVLDSQQFNRSYVHIIYGLSKDLGLAGFRVGVLYSWNKQVLEAASRMARFCAVSTPTQQLCTALLSDDDFMNTFLIENRRRLTDRYHKVVGELEKVGILHAKSKGGLFCWIDLRHILQSCSREEEMKLWKHLLYQVGLHLTPGLACCCDEPGWFRLCFASVDNNTLSVAIQRFQKFAQTAKY